jgi:hypothetical protein
MAGLGKAGHHYRPGIRATCLALLMFVMGCTDSPSRVLSPPETANFAFVVCPQGMSPAQCKLYNDGMRFLRGHSDSFCRQLGTNAYYRDRNNRVFYESMHNYSDPADHTPAWSGGLYENGAVWYTQYAFSDPFTGLAGWMAHEEYHLAFPYDAQTEQHAGEWEQFCGAGFSNQG